MDAKQLKAACRRFEEEHGVEAFVDAMAEIMTERMARQGLQLHFFDDGNGIADRLPAGPAGTNSISNRDP